MRRAAALLVGAALAGAVALAPAFADQKDKRLPALFDQLKAAPSPDAAAGIEEKIWEIWFDSHDKAIDAAIADGQAAMESGDFKTALAMFDRVVKKRPDFAEGWNRRATLYYLMGDYKKSLADIARTLKLEPRHIGAISGLGLVNVALDRLEAAASAYERVLAIDPQNEDAKKNLEALNKALKRKEI